MKTYSGSNAKAAKPARRKAIYAVVAIVSALAIALTVVLAVTLGRKPAADVPVAAPPVEEEPGPGPSTDTPDPPVSSDKLFFLPVENAKIDRECMIDMLTYMPSLNMWKTHNGVDFSAAENASVFAVADGKVLSVQETTLEGIVVSIEHENGLVSTYKSLESASVGEGDTVSGGAAIGVAGKMLVEAENGSHLHLEMTVNGSLVDPMSYLSAIAEK